MRNIEQSDTRRKRVNGKRIYGAWAGRPNGVPEDSTRCIAGVWSNDRGSTEYQCLKKRGHGPDGLWCAIHNPERLAKREMDAQAKRLAARQAEQALEQRGTALIDRLGYGYVHFSGRTMLPTGLVLSFGEVEQLLAELKR